MSSFTVNANRVKEQSEHIITDSGGEVCTALPPLNRTKPRDLQSIVNRSLVMDAMLHIYFRYPTKMVAEWIMPTTIWTAKCRPRNGRSLTRKKLKSRSTIA